MSVASLISQAQSFASTVLNLSTTAMTSATNSAAAVGYSIPNYQAASLPGAPPSSINYTMPTFGDVVLDIPPEPSATLVFQDIPSVEVGVIPTLTATPPVITMPTAPAQVAPFLATMPGLNTAIAFPDPPAALTTPLLDAPVIATRAEPSEPTTNIPGFNAITPVDTTQAPVNIDQTIRNVASSASPTMIAMMDGYVDAMLTKFNPQFASQMAAIEAQLTKYLQGGTGINADVESQIYERSRSKQDAEARRVRDGAAREFADRGFPMPPGAMLGVIQAARQGGADNNAQSARDIVVMQAEMEQKNLQFAVTMSADLRKTLLNTAIAYQQNLTTINGQALTYAKLIADSLVEAYNTAVKAFGIKLDAYKAEAVVYETRLKAAMAGMELYKSEIQALEALTNVDRARVDVYRARIESLSSLANVYRAQIDAVQGRVGLEKLKLEVFQGQVQAYSALVQAKNSEWQGYSAAVEGQTATAKMYESQVQAFNGQVSAFKATVEAKSEAAKAAATTNMARASQYKALLDGYQTVVSARGEKARTQLENQRQTVLAFTAKVNADVANAQVQQGYYKTVSEIAIANAGNNLRAQMGGIDSQKNYLETIARLGTSNAEILGRLASSTMAGMTTLASESVVQ